MTPLDAVKHNSAYSFFKREANDPSHSYLIVSPDTITSLLCAKAFISFLTGKDIERIDELKDVYILPFGDKVLTSDADFLCETAYVMPTQLEKKYFIVRNAETANEAAQNKLLKTLEEPPETAVILLLCANEYAMLPTVKSRCRTVRPDLYEDDVMRSVLESEYPSCKNKSFVTAASGGSLFKLIETAENGIEYFDTALKILTCMRKSKDILPFATQLISKKDSIAKVLDALELILRDCMVFCNKPELISLKDNVMDIRELSRYYAENEVIRVLPVIRHARKRILLGGNVNSIVDELLFSILEEKSKCQR